MGLSESEATPMIANTAKTLSSGSTPSEIRIVHIHLCFLKIGEIDTQKEHFGADIVLQARWREPALDEKSENQLKTVEFNKLWNPQLYIEDTVSEQKESISNTHSARLNDIGEVSPEQNITLQF